MGKWIERWKERRVEKMDKPHKKLKAWQGAMDLCVTIYKVTEGFPGHELYGLTSQMRRAAVSIPCNIAEGSARSSGKESAQFYNIARASLSELDTQIEIAKRLMYIGADANLLKRSSFGLIKNAQMQGTRNSEE